MQRKLIAAPAIAGLLVLPFAGYLTLTMMTDGPFGHAGRNPVPAAAPPQEARAETEVGALSERDAPASRDSAVAPTPAPAQAGKQELAQRRSTLQGAPAPDIFPDTFIVPEVSTERFEAFDGNPVRAVREHPVSTFSIDADTASYSFVRRALNEGMLPQADTVRVEEMVNYFPYDWPGPETAEEPFRANVAVMPTPWNEGTRLMHIAIKGYDLPRATNPKANLVFLIDVSGSMDEPDKLPLLKSAFRLLVTKLAPEDTVSIVTYAGEAGTVLEPTKASDAQAILDAIDTLQPGGSTAGEAGLRQAYRLAQQAFVEGGINRVMLATDGDFNVGQTDDEDLRRLIEEKRRTGVFLSVFGFGRGNLNDRMMQVIAQNGNGTAAYIDTLAEAEKVLVEEASSTLFPIAKDVKIQVEFNPERIAEYRLIGYETRALAREDFNNDRVDAGEIGAGHSVTAIYEVTPTGSLARTLDGLRYGAPEGQGADAGKAGEFAFVKIRYKLPDGDVSRLVTRPVTDADALASLDAASEDQRFSVAVAAFGQKLRDADQTAGMSYDRVGQIASAARGSDPFGYRAGFLSLVRLADALEAGRR